MLGREEPSILSGIDGVSHLPVITTHQASVCLLLCTSGL